MRKRRCCRVNGDELNSRYEELRPFAEVYVSAEAKEKCVEDFVAAWNRVMNLDGFDIK